MIIHGQTINSTFASDGVSVKEEFDVVKAKIEIVEYAKEKEKVRTNLAKVKSLSDDETNLLLAQIASGEADKNKVNLEDYGVYELVIPEEHKDEYFGVMNDNSNVTMNPPSIYYIPTSNRSDESRVLSFWKNA